MWNLVTRIASPGGERGSLSVLFFHRVITARDPLAPDIPTTKEFDTLLGWVQRQFSVIPLSEGVARLGNGTLPPAAAAITFDDGYRDNLENAAPILSRRGIPATLFVASGFLDGGIMFNDVIIEALRRTSVPRLDIPELGMAPLQMSTLEERREAISLVLKAVKHLPADQRNEVVRSFAEHTKGGLPNDLMMTSAQLREFSRLGFEIGAHTQNHPILAVLPDDAARREIVESRSDLENLIDKKVNLFAYPNGRWGKDFDQRHRDMAKSAGFDAAFSTEPGACKSCSDLWKLPRFTPWDKTAARFSLRMLANFAAMPYPR